MKVNCIAKIYFLVIVFLFSVSPARSEITLNIDTVLEELYLTGGDSGSPSDSGSLNPDRIGWQQTGWLPYNNQGVGLAISGINLNLNVSTSSKAIALVAFDVTESINLVASDNRTDYSWMLPEVKAILAQSNGVSLNLAYGSGFSPVKLKVTGVTSVGPEILQVGNGAIQAINGKQAVTLSGANFHPDCTVALRDHRTGEIFPNRIKISQTSTSIQLSVNFTSTPAEWSAEVINPNGDSSGRFRFQVGMPIVPGQTVDKLMVGGTASINSGETTTLTATLRYLDGTEQDVTNSATFRIVGGIPEGVSLLGNELRTTSFTPTTRVSVAASFQTTSGGISSIYDFAVSINRGFSVKIFSVIPEDIFTVRATTSLSEIGGNYTYTWDFNGDGNFNDGQNHPWATYTYPTISGEHTVKVRVTKNSTGEVTSAEQKFRMRKPLASNQPLSPVPVYVGGLGTLYDKNGDSFEFDYDRIKNGFILLTHGLESNGSEPWLQDLAKAIEGSISEQHGSGAVPNIAIYNWEKDANPYKLDFVFGVGVRDILAITTAGKTNGGYLADWVAGQEKVGFIDKDAPIHFIGHSAGGFVTGQLATDLNEAGCLVDRVTMLDTPMASPEHLRKLPTEGTFVERLITSAYGHRDWPLSPKPNGSLHSLEYYPSVGKSAENFLPGEEGHGLSYRRYEATATVGDEDYLTPLGVSFWNSPFIFGPRNPRKESALSSLSDLAVGPASTEDQESLQSPRNLDVEEPIKNFTSYGTMQEAAGNYTLIENSSSDSGISTQIEVPLGAYSVSFFYQFQDGDESDRLVASAGDDAALFIVPNLPLYRTQQFEGSIGIAELGQTTITLDFRLDGTGDANSSVTISSIKFLISDDVDQDGIPNAVELSLGTNPKSLDTDGDGLSDYDELHVYFTNPTSTHTDTDGVPDGMEVSDGTDPSDPESTFRITEVAPLDNGDVRISFASVGDRSYRIRGSESPYGQTNWTIQSGVRSNNGKVSITDPGRQNDFRRFYYWVEIEEPSLNIGLLSSTPNYKLGSYFIPSKIANLSALSVSAGDPNQPFDSGVTTYALSVPNNVTSTTLTPSVSHAGATVKVNAIAVVSGAASASIQLDVGSNLILVEVTAEDGLTKQTYTVTVNRARSNVATLTDLTLSAGTINPSFAAGTTSYTLAVENSISMTTLTPTVSHAGATVKVNATAVFSGISSALIALNVGSNLISVEVTAEDGLTKRTYTVTVSRARFTVAALKGLTLSAGPINPKFDADTVAYAMSVANKVTSTTVTPIVESAGARVKVNGIFVISGSASRSIPLALGSKKITVEVIAQDGMTKRIYTVTVNRARSTRLTLSGLTLSAGRINPEFAAGKTSYALSVANGVDSTTLTPIVKIAGARVRVNGTKVASGSASPGIPLVVGINTINVDLIARDRVTKRRYIVTITRAAPISAKLKKLEIEGARLKPGFSPRRMNYKIITEGSLKTVRIRARAQHPSDRIIVNGIKVKSGKFSSPIAIKKDGTTMVRVVIIAKNGSHKTYRLKFVKNN